MSGPAAFSMDTWLDTLALQEQAAMRALRAVILKAAPRAAEIKSYGLPAFKVDGKGLVCMNVWKKHCAFYPMSADAIDAHKDALAGFALSKGTIKFTPLHPIPEAIITSIIQFRLREMNLAT
jgi:uncharacterized protein YdhG (YjbR/CyaY superfamily)